MIPPIALLALLALPAAAADPAGPPVAVFADLDGSWEGTFVAWDPAGKELYRIEVRQTYETTSDTTQTVASEDRLPDGTRVLGRGVNTAIRREDGTLELRCVVEKSNGDRVEHDGRLVRGAGGEIHVLWTTERPDRVESFLESVRRVDGEERYLIHGTGQYGDLRMLMSGEYRRAAGSPERP